MHNITCCKILPLISTYIYIIYLKVVSLLFLILVNSLCLSVSLPHYKREYKMSHTGVMSNPNKNNIRTSTYITMCQSMST